MRDAATAALPNETGGILLGYRSVDGVRVAGAIEVPDPRATPTSYRRRHRTAAKLLSAALGRQAPRSPVGYVGEWHSHPAPQPPSTEDISAIAATAAAASDDIVLVVLCHTGRGWSTIVTSAGREKTVVERAARPTTPRPDEDGGILRAAEGPARRRSAGPRRQRRNPS